MKSTKEKEKGKLTEMSKKKMMISQMKWPKKEMLCSKLIKK